MFPFVVINLFLRCVCRSVTQFPSPFLLPYFLNRRVLSTTNIGIVHILPFLPSSFRYLLEQTRIVHNEDDERAYHVFYQLFGAPTELLETDFGITRGYEEYTFLGPTDTDTIEGKTDKERYHLTMQSLALLGIDASDQRSVFSSLAAVLHLGEMAFCQVRGRTEQGEQMKTGERGTTGKEGRGGRQPRPPPFLFCMCVLCVVMAEKMLISNVSPILSLHPPFNPPWPPPPLPLSPP